MIAHRELVSAVAAALLLLTGCVGRSPDTAYYSLRATAAGGGASGGAQGPAIRVGPAQLPRFLDRPQLARRTGESEIQYDEFHRWAGGLQAELIRVVGADLGELVPSERIVLYPADAPFPLDYRIVLGVDRFEAGPGDTVTLRARWAILPGDGGDALATGQTKLEQPVASDAAADIVAAHSAALGVLSRDVAERLRALHQQRAR